MRDLVAAYRAQGWAPVRIPPLSKAPVDRDWPAIEYGPEHFAPGDNIGVKLGEPSDDLVDVDLDCLEAVRLAPAFLPPTITFGRASKPRSHWIYRSPGVKTWKPKRAKVELRSTGVQTVFPGSTHETGEPIEWYDVPNSGPAPLPANVLRAHVCRLALGSLLLRLIEPLQRASGVHDFLLALAGGLKRSGWNADAALDLVARSIGLDEPHREAAIRDTFTNEETTGWPTVTELVGPPDAKALQRLAEDDSMGFAVPAPVAEAETVSGYVLNDTGNATRLLAAFGENLRYAEGIGWLRWDGLRWEISDGPWPEATMCALAIMNEGLSTSGSAGKALIEHGRQSGNANRLRGCLEIASHDPAVRVTVDVLDADQWALNCTNGTVDLRTGELRAHAREDLITKLCPVPYDPAATCPRFDRFLLETMDGDTELAAYLLRFLGYGITGSTREHVFGLWHGATGGNGKSTLIDLLSYVLDDYAITVAPDLLLAQPNSQHSTGLLDFRGARLVLSNEAPEGKRWNESLVKRLTGGDVIRARRMRQDFIEFTPSHTLIVAANARPLVREQGPAFWRRVNLLPWAVSFTGREDKQLPATLRSEAAGVLRYLVAGCLAWQHAGLLPPAQIVAAGDDYRESQDTLGAFVQDAIAPKSGNAIAKSAIYNAYRQWATQGGEPYLLSARSFHRQLAERQFRTTKRQGTRCYVDVEITRTF